MPIALIQAVSRAPLGPLAITGIAAIIDGKISDFSFKTLLGWRKFINGAQDPTYAH